MFGQDPDFLDYLSSQERQDINEDKYAKSKNAPANFPQAETADLHSDSDCSEEDENRNKKGRRVRFAA
jgi:hypothetical protein